MCFAIFLGVTAHSVFKHRGFFFIASPDEAARAIYGTNPFPESVKIAKYIREHSAANSRIAVIGSEPQIYFYSERHSATGYIYTYALMEPQPYASAMQKEMIAQMEDSKPEFVVLVSVPSSWLGRPKSDTTIFDWLERYGPAHLRTVGLIDIFADRPSIYRWDEKAVAAAPESKSFIRVYARSDLL